MNRLSIALVSSIVCILISGYATALVRHPEDLMIVGFYGSNRVCFNNDGYIALMEECDGSEVDEGYVEIVPTGATDGDWAAGASGINACGTVAVNPVSSATCPLTYGYIAPCTGDNFILVQTTQSGHFFALKAAWDCGFIAPETTGLYPCLSTDAFDPLTGCAPEGSPPVLQVERGYIQLEISRTPPPAHCADSSHYGRLVVDVTSSNINVCTQTGWKKTHLSE